jgi:predicted alpha/beta hydrolase family esterase
MRTSEADILIVPGLRGGTPEHWYSRWGAKLSTARRIEQVDFARPILTDWTNRIVEEVNSAARPVILVAHSLGALTLVHVAQRLAGKVSGAFLVAPPSERVIKTIPEIDPAFAPIPMFRLPFPAIVIASRDDFYAEFAESEAMVLSWGATLVDAGNSGHINDESGHGPWPEGLLRFAGFMKTL